MSERWAKVPSMRAFQVTTSVLVALSLAACGDDGGGDGPAAGTGGDYMRHEQVPCPDTIPEMHLGMKALGSAGKIRGELIDADKIPVGWYHNDWVVKFTGPNEEPLSDLEMTYAYTFMRVHRHDGGQLPQIEPLEDGEFSVTGLNITMNGPWEFIFELSAVGAGGEPIVDEVTFHVCNDQPEP